MIAFINGIQVVGTPEEIEKYRQIANKKKSTLDFFKTGISDIPDHVKNYGKYNKVYAFKGNNGLNAWF